MSSLSIRVSTNIIIDNYSCPHYDSRQLGIREMAVDKMSVDIKIGPRPFISANGTTYKFLKELS